MEPALDARCHQLHFVSVKTISIKELHAATGRWVRMARKTPVIVTDRGEQVAVLKPYVAAENAPPVFRGRDWTDLPTSNVDTTDLVSEDRDSHLEV